LNRAGFCAVAWNETIDAAPRLSADLRFIIILVI
jgi:hypothetical protein